ncbi:DNA mismatch repair protein [Grosmannia clavigera kw1407]|uniref:DNA mismatch repair protein n=1 Tax=Grosmannia clavigera (strain kw1407 / UAMH 11150) TaxID=655863 RepID=F0XS21_GROCL|nr:DNA mismatch repair protein [Grosmannia clavigera kw1407]EFW99624.1 DNA mismatch repair protein [Grosmannia clavigera kw1407]
MPSRVLDDQASPTYRHGTSERRVREEEEERTRCLLSFLPQSASTDVFISSFALPCIESQHLSTVTDRLSTRFFLEKHSVIIWYPGLRVPTGSARDSVSFLVDSAHIMGCWHPGWTLVRAIYSPIWGCSTGVTASGRAATALRRCRPRPSLAVLVSTPSSSCPSSSRGKKTTTVVRLQDLPQGVLLPDETAVKPLSGGRTGRRTRKGGTFDRLSAQSAQSPASGQSAQAVQPAVLSGRAAQSAHSEDSVEDEPVYPTVILQARRNMHRFANCILLTRVGGFYEMYFEHAQEFGPLLNIKVASKKTNAGPVPMAGFPFFQLDRFLKILVHDLNRYVAISEEFPNSAADKVRSGGLMHDRRVARIVTPGTLIDENFMDPYTNNYVMGIHADADADAPGQSATMPSASSATSSPMTVASPKSVSVGLAWLDLSTGHFYTQATTLSAVGSVLSRVAPREVVLDEQLQLRRDVHPLFPILEDDRQQQQVVTFAPPAEGAEGQASGSSLDSLSDWAHVLESEIPASDANTFTAPEIAAGSLLLRYVRDRLQGLTMKLQPPVRYEDVQAMTIDKNTMRSLEIKQTLRDGLFRGSLLHAIRRTVTKSGARLLNEWLSAPSTSLELIEARQNLVSRFLEDEPLRDDTTLLLRKSYDSHRLVQKFALGRGDPDDLLDLAKTVSATQDIVGLLRHAASAPADCLHAIADRISLERPLAIAQRIRESVDEEGLMHQHAIEASEADVLMTLAEEAEEADRSLPDDRSILRKKAKKAKTGAKAVKAATAATTATATATATSASRRKTPSLRDYYGEDSEAWVMKPSASSALAVLHAQLADLTAERVTLTEELRHRLQAPSLVLKWTPGLGHICHLKGRAASRASSSSSSDDGEDTPAQTHTTISSSRTTRSLHVPEWTALGQRLDQVRLHIRAEEQRVFQAIRETVVRSLVPLRRNAAVLDELDIGTSFARLALEQNLCRPRLHRGTTTAIVGGRHPTVEGGLAEQGRSFARNDCFVRGVEDAAATTATTSSHGSLWLITGPNMAGKSTFLRQNALITILAQVGCFVPAEQADLGLVDALFSRVGSADNLFRDQSTFMVEMLETAHILRAATPRSFVIMDEIGRGTTPEDGTAVAFAALHHLVRVNRCRTLFATHFHGLANLAAAEGMISGGSSNGPVETYCTDVEEDGRGGFAYVHRLRRGVNRQSHALKVARMAGMPEQAIRVAEEVLAQKRTAGQVQAVA